MRWSRRAHLYCGLALVPWVCLYGITGLFFNHPTLAGDDALRFGRSELPPELLQRAPSADDVARSLERQLGEQLRLNDLPPPQYTGSLRAKGKLGDRDVRLFLGMRSGNGSLRFDDPDVGNLPESLLPLPSIDPEGQGATAWEQAALAIAGVYIDDPTLELKLDRAPTLTFGADVDGEPWVVTYDPKDRELEFERPGSEAVEVPRLLQRLHMTHHYPDRFGAGWIHALFVDLTAGCLLMWCLTGLIMWWQMRKLRRIGAVVLLSGASAVIWLMAQVVPGML